jgi:basic membrane lipoprotein Med (substrate-binding protein (PBP1-ABC) superfamily)
MLELAKEVKDGAFKPRKVLLDMKTGYVDLVLNEQLKDRIPDAARTSIDEARKAIVAGTLDVGKD